MKNKRLVLANYPKAHARYVQHRGWFIDCNEKSWLNVFWQKNEKLAWEEAAFNIQLRMLQKLENQ